MHAIRSGRWKLHLPHSYQSLERAGGDGSPGSYVRKEIELSLFDLDADPAETTNVAERQPDVVARLMDAVERARDDLGDSLTKRTGKNVRTPGTIDASQPAPGHARTGSARPPNVLLIMADDLNDIWARSGHPLSRRRTSIDCARAASGSIAPTPAFRCAASSRVSLLTGRRP